MNVNLSIETEKALKAIAARNGQDVADYAARVLEQDVKEKQTLFETDDEDPYALERAIERMKNRTPEEVEESRKRIFEPSKPPRPLPEGKTIFDVICGQWPGDETDEEVAEALRRLS